MDRHKPKVDKSIAILQGIWNFVEVSKKAKKLDASLITLCDTIGNSLHSAQTGCLVSLYKIASKGLNVEILQILFLKTTWSFVYFSKYVCCHAAK